MNQRTVNFNGVTVNPLHMSANPRHRVQKDVRIPYIRHIFDQYGLIRHQGSSQNRQRRVFCAPDFNLADQRISAIDCILFHISSYFCCTGSLSIASISSFSA